MARPLATGWEPRSREGPVTTAVKSTVGFLVGARHGLATAGVRPSPIPLLAAIICGCATPSSPARPDTPHTLSIGYAGQGGQLELLQQLTTERLLRSTLDGRHEPQLAERWSVDQDGLVVTLTLRQGVRFHDGVELSANIVKTALDGARSDANQVQAFPLLANIQSVDVAGEQLRLHLKRPSLLLLDDLGIRIQRGTSAQPVGTGPFALESVSEGSMTLVANPTYHQGRPAMDVVTVTGFPTVRTAWAAMMRGEIDFLFEVPVQAREFVEAESRVELFRTERPYAYMIGFNLQNQQLRDTRVRQALNHAVDRRAIIERALRGEGFPASGVWASHWAYNGVEKLYRHDPALADQMLTRAGYPPVGVSPTADVMPARLRFTCLIPSDPVPYEPMALLIQRQLYDIGVDMRVEAVGPRELQARVTSGDYDALLVQQNIGRGLSRPYVFWHSSQPSAPFGYTAADVALDALRHAVTPEDVSQAASAFQSVLYNDPPAIFIATPRQARAVHRQVTVSAAPGQDLMDTVWRWRRAEVVVTQ